jgi:hypothetical protein
LNDSNVLNVSIRYDSDCSDALHRGALDIACDHLHAILLLLDGYTDHPSTDKLETWLLLAAADNLRKIGVTTDYVRHVLANYFKPCNLVHLCAMTRRVWLEGRDSEADAETVRWTCPAHHLPDDKEHTPRWNMCFLRMLRNCVETLHRVKTVLALLEDDSVPVCSCQEDQVDALVVSCHVTWCKLLANQGTC